MIIASVQDFFNPATFSEARLNLPLPESFSDADERTIRTAMVAFNLTGRSDNLIASYKIKPILKTFKESLQNGDIKAWVRLAAIIIIVGLSFFSGFRLARYVITTYKDACLKVASGNNFTDVIEYGRIIYTRPAQLLDYLKGPLTLSGLWILLVPFITLGATATLMEAVSTGKNIQLKIEPFRRSLPGIIGNPIEHEYLLDPITREDIPDNQRFSPKYIYITNTLTDGGTSGYIIGAAACMRALLKKRPRIGSTGCEIYSHPVDNHILTEEESLQLRQDLAKIFGLAATEIGLKHSAQAHRRRPKEKVNAFLDLFDPSIYPLLPGFSRV